MIDPLLFALGSGAANAAMAATSKGAERSGCRLAPYSLVTLATASLIASGVALRTGAAWSLWQLWVFGGAMGGLFLVAVACMLRANRVWPPSAVWSAANMAFILPILLSALFMAEALHWLDAGILVGILLLLAGLADPAAPAATVAAESRSERRWLLLAAVFVTNGLLMFGFKAFGTLLPQVGSSCLVAVMYGCGALVALVLHAWRGSFRFTRAEAGWGAATGGATGAAVLLLLPSMSLPAAVAFPLIQGTSLVGGVLLCALLFRERLTLRKFGGLACGVIALVLAGMR